MVQFKFNPISKKLDLVETSSSPTGDISYLTPDTGPIVTPTNGNVNVYGTTDQIETTGTSSTVTWRFPVTGIKSFRPIVVQSDSATFSLTDANTWQKCTKGTVMTLTVPTNASVAFAIGTEIDIYQQGAGQVIVAASGGVTINSAFGNLKIASQYTGGSLKKTDTNVWELVGNLTA